jgi:hypothetical protein
VSFPGQFRDVAPGDVEHIAPRLRAADRLEIVAAEGHEDVLAILRQSVRASHLTWTCCAPDGEPFALLGVAPLNLLAGQGVPWLLATDRADRFPRALLVEPRRLIPQMRRLYPELVNYVHAENVRSIGWLRRLGFAIEPARPFGARGEPFHRFTMGCT